MHPGERAGWLLSIAALALPVPLWAAGLTVTVTDSRGRPLSDTVITSAPPAGTAVPTPVPETRTIDQRDETFIPYLEVFHPGDSVVFRNSDSTRHHVYSFSPLAPFELVLAPGESSAPRRLDKPGTLAIGCNIHDRMITYLYVSEAPYLARSGADGRARLEGLPPGKYTVRAWHPQLRPGAVVPAQEATIDGAEARLSFSLSVLPDPRLQSDRERGNY